MTVAALVFAEEVEALKGVAALEGWGFAQLTPLSFVLEIVAQDGSHFWVRCDGDGYKADPPLWRWCDVAGENLDSAALRPRRSRNNFFHDSGIICAPWSRLAYRSVDPRGPHSDWTIGNWQANGYTRECKTLAAMATRIALELQTGFQGRFGGS